jgi:fatty acid-binding protein DegV
MTEGRKTAIITDSSCDLSDEQLSEHHIHMVSLRIISQRGEYRDRAELHEDQLYEMLKTELPKTSLPLPETYPACTTGSRRGRDGRGAPLHLLGAERHVQYGSHDRGGLPGSHEHPHCGFADALHGAGRHGAGNGRGAGSGGRPDTAVQKARKVRSSQLGMFVIRTLEYLRKGGPHRPGGRRRGQPFADQPIIYINDDGVYQTLAKARATGPPWKP